MTRFVPLAKRIAAYTRLTDDGCWEWTAALDRAGYGLVYDGKMRPAHRASYELYRGPIPEGLQLDHLCRNPPCVNPDHLEPVTHMENQRRSPLTSLGKTRCKRGHPFDERNTRRYVRSNGNPRRTCRVCDLERKRAVRAAEKAARK